MEQDIFNDIVEVGVFKGSGTATFVKFLEVFMPNSNKKLVVLTFLIQMKVVLFKTKDTD